ncbi:MAG: DEAD/DEAH box helicase family protein [Acidobacteriota bacterium]|nr:DEAD/DEAH box helicase family protein [Acidobacteriota bacterium]
MSFSENLILFKYLLKQFGFEKFENLQEQYKLRELSADTADHSLFYLNLANAVRFDSAKLREYDENIIRHLETINRHRSPKINLKYYQYFSLLLTEYYLDRYFDNAPGLAESLEQFGREPAGGKSEIEFDKGELNLIAYWMATGSGKTLILHFNILQYRHYAKKYSSRFNNFILLTPGEGLSNQHLQDLKESGIESELYLNNKAGNHVKVIDIHKIKESASGQGVTVSVDEFGQQNVVFVDEGHKGNDKEEGVWRMLREKMGFNGFTFEYSATFGQVGATLQEYYAKRIIFDYSYRYFYKDGYGKDYYIDNIAPNEAGDAEPVKYRYLTLNLLLFLQQKHFYRLNKEEVRNFQIENPLLIFVGHTVNPKASNRTDRVENERTISDVSLLIHFFKDFLENRPSYEAIIEEVVGCKGIFSAEFSRRLEWLFSRTKDAREIYNLLIREVFNAETHDGLELHTISKAQGEIALKIKGNNPYFGLINIGDASSFKTAIRDEFEFLTDKLAEPVFPNLSAISANPVNILIGARKFIEGWNNYRVSSIGLINFGKSEGSQIIQLFGRGVRLRGKDNSLKRSAETDATLPFLPIVETLNVFGLNAGYITIFKENLEKEGIKTQFHTFTVPAHLYRQREGKTIGELNLITLRKPEGIKPFYTTDIFELEFDRNLKPKLDLTTKRVWIAPNGEFAGNFTPNVISTLDAYKNEIDFYGVYLELLELKRARRFYNLKIKPEVLREIASEQFCEILTDAPLKTDSLRDIENLQKIAVGIFKKYVEAFYNPRLRVYEARHLRSVKLTEADPCLQDLDYTLTVAKTDGNGNLHPGIDKILAQIQTVIDRANADIGVYANNGVLINAWFEKHLFQPLLVESQKQDAVFHIESISPKGLNDGEAQFVEDFGKFIRVSNDGGEYRDCSFYLLRNRTKSKGFGFYFSSAGGFFPDFLLWIKRKIGDNEVQYLTFIDPHGLRNEQDGFNSDRVRLSRYLQSQNAEFANVSGVILNSFILSPSTFRGANIAAWGDFTTEDEMKAKCEENNILEMSQDGAADPLSYVRKMVNKILEKSP